MKDLFDEETFDWVQEWKGMPAFIQEDKKIIFSVQVNFETTEDINTFSELIGQRISFKTKSVLFPVKTDEERVIYVNAE